ncbi:MAG TPA: hypothetical protein VGF95_07430 [Solirubrobacteraceae bacterium]
MPGIGETVIALAMAADVAAGPLAIFAPVWTLDPHADRARQSVAAAASMVLDLVALNS